jgi:hexosaminidase
MIWSDMYFHIAAHGDNWYEGDAPIPQAVVEKIPQEAQLVYWDYYHEEKDFYRKWLVRHREMGFEPIMASGIWTWLALWYDHQPTVRHVDPCIAACRELGLEELFFTMWGDDGATCEYDSALAGMAYAAELSWQGDRLDDDLLAARFKAICKTDLQAVITAAGVNLPRNAPDCDLDQPPIWRDGRPYSPPLLWDDPLLGLYWQRMAMSKHDWEASQAHYAALTKTLAGSSNGERGVCLDHAWQLARFFRDKIALRLHLEEAYHRDRSQLSAVADEARALADTVDELALSFRTQWLRRNKPRGWRPCRSALPDSASACLRWLCALTICWQNGLNQLPSWKRPRQPAAIAVSSMPTWPQRAPFFNATPKRICNESAPLLQPTRPDLV